MADDQSFTFLFTDIEGSTPMWEAARSTMQEAVARHETLLRTAVQQHGGRVVKTMGDGLHAVFDRAVDGIRAAADGQRAVLNEAWPPEATIRVRMGLHTGTAETRADDYYGPSVNRAARLMGSAHGSQIVLSHSTLVALAGSMPDDLTVEDLGEVHLRGVGAPAHAYQLIAGDLPSEFPPLAGLDIPTNLPATPTSFVGRHEEVDDVLRMLQERRLVTLAGFGGVGKTRLATEVAAHAMAHYPDGVWFVELASVQSPMMVSQTIAAVAGIAESPGTSLTESLSTALGDARTLLVLDNCEHLIDEVAKVAEHLCSHTANLRILATSREPLAITAEAIYDLTPLPLSPHGPAVQLFVDRARAVNNRFAPTRDDLVTIAGIVRHLDGIPLAVELAAARIRTMGPAQVLHHLDDRFALLSAGSRTADSRQQSLRALVDWSYELLTPQERGLFDRLSVFVGDFTVEAASAVAGSEESPLHTFDVLTRLLDQSLVLRHPSEDEVRFALLETLRSYGAERLADTDLTDESCRRHAHYFAHRSVDADSLLKGSDQATWHDRFTADEPDLLQALRWLAANDPDLGLDMAAQLARFWYRRGMATVGLEATRRALRTADTAPSDSRALAMAWEAFFVDLHGDRPQAAEIAEAALAMAETVGSPSVRAQALNTLAGFENDAGSLRKAADMWREALDELDRAGIEWVTAPLFNLGYGLVELGEVDEARPIVERLVAYGAAHDDPWTQTIGELLSAYVAFGAGELDDAEARAAVALDRFRDQGAIFHEAETCILRACVAEQRGDLDLARSELAVAQEAMADTGIFDQAEALVLRARVAMLAEDVAEAADHLRRAIEDNRADPNLVTTAKILHEAARIAYASEAVEIARRLMGMSAQVYQRADAVPAHYQRTEAAEIGSTPAAPAEIAAMVDLAEDALAGNPA